MNRITSRSAWIAAAVLVLFLGLLAPLAEGEYGDLSVTGDVTYASKYMTDGFKVGGDHPVWQPSLGVSSPLVQGVSVMFWSSLQLDRDNQEYDELDLMARYSQTFYPGQSYEFNVHGYYDYWVYPNGDVMQSDLLSGPSSESSKGNKLHAGISATHLIPIAGSFLVPTYNLYYWIYWAQNALNQYEGGAHHEFMLQYYYDLPLFIPKAREIWVNTAASVNYNDGAFGVQPGWSHSTAMVGAGMSAWGAIFSVTFNHQWSYQPTVDPTDEYWTTVSFTKELL